MLIHVRLTCPEDLTEAVCGLLTTQPWVTNVTRQRGAVLVPAGDLVECDLAKEKAGVVVAQLQDLGLGARGGIVLTTPSGTPFDGADVLEAAAPGHPDDAVIWESVEAAAEDGAVPTVSFHVFLVIAVALAAIAVITDSAVLVVGAMVVGPEFSAVAAACAGLVLGRWGLVGRSLRLLVLSFAFAVLVVTILAVLARVTGMIDVAEVVAPRPNTGFIWHPDRWSFVVALLAGAAGALALAVERTATMVGVFISVTTVPAAGNLALGLAFWDRGEMVGSIAQLGANLAGMLVAGTLLLVVVRLAWTPLTVASERWFGRRDDAVARSR